MDEKDIPQDRSPVYEGQRKRIYATRNGQYVEASTDGWQDENFVTEQAVRAFAEQTERAWQDYRQGRRSALWYLMFRHRHDEASLAAATGQFRWQLRRHFDPARFAALSARAMARYEEAFQLGADEIRNPRHDEPPAA